MSSFQGSDIAEFNSQQPQQVQQEQQQPPQEQPSQEQQQIVNRLKPSIDILNSIKETDSDKIKTTKLYQFLQSYVSFLHNSSLDISQLYNKDNQQNSVHFFISAVKSIPDNNNDLIKMTKLDLPEGDVLSLIDTTLKQLPEEQVKEINRKFNTLLESYSSKSKSPTKTNNFLDKELTIPGSSKKLKCKWIILIIFLLLLLVAFAFYYFRLSNTNKLSRTPSISTNSDSE